MDLLFFFWTIFLNIYYKYTYVYYKWDDNKEFIQFLNTKKLFSWKKNQNIIRRDQNIITIHFIE